MQGQGPLDRLRADAQRAIARGAGHFSAPLSARAKRWWDLPAKEALARELGAQERRRAAEDARAAGDRNAHNDRFDAMRHARWSRRMSDEIGPLYAQVAGAAHEFENQLPRPPTLARWGAPKALQELARRRHWHEQGREETLMDSRNNAEGRRAAAERRAIDPGNLQTSLHGPMPRPSSPYR